MSVKIYFDLDGTVYNLYGITEWEPKLRAENPNVFREGNFIGDYQDFMDICHKLLEKSVQFGVITWLPMQASPEYEVECELVKREWVQQYMPFVSEFTAQSYGVPKQNAIIKRAKTMYLLDDNTEICEMWQTEKMRIAVNVNKGERTTIEALKEIYAKLE